MGASRKLQGEIDRVLKKVQEGVDVFDSIWNKVYDTDNANQKEKFEADLKKEIKKLQRYRDQIKTWIQSSEIKDKKVSASYEQALMDARKLIEREMERFKICEKETKTKAFSKEGLGQQPKTDPKEKAKSETRDWLNNVVSELESQIDSFEAELEGLSVKKGKTRPPRLIHLETSITRHKAHIMKLELILRLLDNDELSPEQVNDVKDCLDDYVERNQEVFEDFSDVDFLYNSLPLEKVESLEDLVAIGPPGVKAVVTSSNQQGSSVQEQVEETASQDSSSDIVPKTPSKNSIVGSSAPTTPTGSHATGTLNATAHILPGLSTASAILSGSTSARGVLENSSAIVPSSPINIAIPSMEEDIASSPGRKSSPALSETGARGVGRGGLNSPLSTSNPLSSGGSIPSNGALGVAVPSASEMAKRNILVADERLGSTGMVQPMVSPLSNRMMLPQGAKANDGINSNDSGNVGEAAVMAGRVFSPSIVPGIQWRPGSSFQNQNEAGQFRGRTEIAPDQREKFLQRFQQVQQQGQSTMLGMPPLAGGNHKQFSSQPQNPLLQQFNSQSSSVLPQVGLGVGVQAPGLNAVAPASLQQQSNSTHQQSTQQAMMSSNHKDAEVGHAKIEELQHQQALSDDSAAESAMNAGVVKNPMNEDDLKASYALDTPAGVTGSLSEPAQMPRDMDLSSGQPLQSNQSSGSLGVIGRRSVSDLGAIGDNLGGPTMNSGGMHDHLYSLQMLESAYYKLPQPKDSERTKSYTPRHPAVTPSSYPQVQAPIVNNPAFWERLGADNFGTDTLFFSFYYQQNTYQQYLAAKELKKQSWRYHKKYNTWFQRHEEPKVATDDYEQGTYVYFDFHISDELQHGWNTMGAFSSKTSDSYKKSSRIRNNKCGSGSAGHQPNKLTESRKKQTKLSPPKVQKSTEKKSDKPSEIKKPVMNPGSNNNNFYDGIPHYQRALYQKSRSMRTKLGSEVSSRLGRAGTLGLGKAVEVLDTLGSSMTSLNPNSGFVSGVTIKGNELSILAFEVANTVVKGYSLMESVSNKNVQQLKEVVLTSEGVQHLMSKDMDELLKMVATDKREELKVFAREVIRFGNRCKNPQWHNLDRYFEKHSKDPPKQLKEEADSVMQHFMTLVQCTAELYQELNTLDRLEQDYQHKHQIKNKSNVTPKGEDLASLKVELKSQRKKVKSLKKKSLWLKCMEEVVEKLVNIVLFLTREINSAFGSTNAETESKGVLSIQRLGPAGLSLHYANIILQIDSIVARSVSVPSSTRELLYQNLPPSIKSSFRSKLKAFHVKEELTVIEIKAEMEKTLRWLAPLATNTSKAHHGFGWVGEWASTQSGAKFEQTAMIEIIRIETLHHADKAKADKCILELLLWLNHMSKQFKVAAKSGGMVTPTKSLKHLISLEKDHRPTLQPANNSPVQCLENQGMLRDISNRKRTFGLSKSQCFESAKMELTKQDRLSKSSGHSPASTSLDFLAAKKQSSSDSSSVPVTDFDLDKESIYYYLNL